MSDDVYRRQQFGQRTGFGERPALLVIDFVNGFHDPEVLGGGNIAAAVLATVPLLGFFRDQGLPVIFTRIVYGEDGSDAGLWCQKVPRLRDLTETNRNSHVVDALAPRAGEAVIRKTQASAFCGTHLPALLISRSIDTLVVTGCTTSGCVRASVIDAMSLNYRTVVATDCVGDRAIGPHDANLFDMGQKYSDLMTGREIMSELDRAGSKQAVHAASALA
jgi:maleamate amidohydrolase